MEFDVVKEIGIVSYSANTYIIEYDGGLAVQKVFKDRFVSNFVSEVEGALVADDLGIGPRVYEIRDMSIVLEYLEDYRNTGFNKLKMYDLDVVRRSFGELRKLHDMGFAHFDFNPGNVMINDAGDIKLIDFEYLFRYKAPKPEFLDAPIFSGKSFFGENDIVETNYNKKWISRFATKGPMALWRWDWHPHIGLTPRELLNPSRLDAAKQMRQLLMVKVPKKIKKIIK